MPLYTYRCKECGAEIDLVSTIESRNEPKRHPHQTRDTSALVGQIYDRDEVFAWQAYHRGNPVPLQEMNANRKAMGLFPLEDPTPTCDGELVRDELELTSRTPEAWKP